MVKQLISEQFPQWRPLPITPVASSGWDNKTFRLGEKMSVRLPSAFEYAPQVLKEHRWLPILAAQLSIAIPVPIALGQPSETYPWHWSVYSWFAGETASRDNIKNLSPFAEALAEFLIALQKIDTAGGPMPGLHNFYRGGNLAIYDEESRRALALLEGKIESVAVRELWENALESTWHGQPVWVHGDISRGNLLVCDGQLSAVIDFGTLGVGDPACDLTIAWTLFDAESRKVFRTALAVDDATWIRGRGWALWKALVTLAQLSGTDPRAMSESKRVLTEIVANRYSQ